MAGKGFTSMNENSRCKTRNGDNPSMEFGRSQEQEGGYPGSVESLAGWGVISRTPHGRIDVMFGPVVTTEAQLAFSGARIHSNNTAEMTALIKHCLFLVLVVQSPVMSSRVFVTILCTLLVCICLGTIQARTHVQLAFARAQRRLRLTMQHVYGHSGNLGNECADHAAALGTFGLISNHNVATRWIHHNFDASVCFDGCDNISGVLERLQHIRTNATSFHQDRG